MFPRLSNRLQRITALISVSKVEKKLNKTIKIDAVLPTVEAGSNGLSESQNCVCQTWAMLTAQQAIAKIAPEEQFQKALREKNNQ